MFLSTCLLGLATVAAQPTTNTVSWHDGPLSKTISVAAREEKMVLLYFWRDGSDYCSRFWQDTLASEEVQGPLGEFVCYSANAGLGQTTRLIEKFNVRTLPWIVILDPEGEPEDSLAGYVGRDDFLGELDRIGRGEGTLSDLVRRASEVEAKSAADFETRFRLAGKYQELGRQEQHDAILASMRSDDPKGKHYHSAQAHLWEAGTKARQSCSENGGECAEGGECGDGCDMARTPQSLVAFAKATPHVDLRFQAWNQVANFEAARSQTSEAVIAFQHAWKDCPEEQALGWSADVAYWIATADGERAAKEKKFALQLAEKSLALAEKLEPESDSYYETYGEMPKEHLVAVRMSTLALALDLSGKSAKAKRLAEKAVAMAEIDQTTEVLARLDA